MASACGRDTLTVIRAYQLARIAAAAALCCFVRSRWLLHGRAYSPLGEARLHRPHVILAVLVGAARVDYNGSFQEGGLYARLSNGTYILVAGGLHARHARRARFHARFTRSGHSGGRLLLF